MPRHKVPKTDYVSKLKDGETPGYWLLKQKRVLSKKEFERVIHMAARAFSVLVYGNVLKLTKLIN